MIKDLFSSLLRRVLLRVDRFGLKEWVVLVYFLAQPMLLQRCVDGFDYAWHLLQAFSTFATADIAEHIIGAYQSQVERRQLLVRIREWGLLITLGAALILLVKSTTYGL